MTILLPIGLYRTYSDFKKEKTFQVSYFGKVKVYEGEKANNENSNTMESKRVRVNSLFKDKIRRISIFPPGYVGLKEMLN